jgi:NAD(P)-dependent dehydrogenase (short-subunit alcohol dehydrogenase family)
MRLGSDIAAIITGGAGGLGAATARALAGSGVKVALFDLQEDRGEEVAREIGGVFCSVDVTSDESVAAGFARARLAHGQERILVNCAGGGGTPTKTASRSRQDGSIKTYPLGLFDAAIQRNLVGTFRCVALSAAGMMTLEPRDHGERGTIINTASVAAEDGQVGQVAYAAAKAAIVGMTLPIARDLMNEGIRINTILPGIFDTPLLARLPEKVKDALKASVPFPKKLGEPAEYAHLALTLIENVYVNGEDIRIDGAIRMAPR